MVVVKASPFLRAETCKNLDLDERVHGILKKSPGVEEQLTKSLNLKITLNCAKDSAVSLGNIRLN